MSSASFYNLLDQLNAHESNRNETKKNNVRQEIEELFRDWIQQRNSASGGGGGFEKGQVLAFGSSRLGTSNSRSDLDACCVAPNHITRYDFFSGFCSRLKMHRKVGGIRSVPRAFVPVIKFNFAGVEVDLTFVRLMKGQTVEKLLKNPDACVKILDKFCQRSVNGRITADKILDSVPNLHAFRTAVRAVKLWAKRRAIYGSMIGFLGGISWTILVAFVCRKSHDNANSVDITKNFFSIFRHWNWPNPVSIGDSANPADHRRRLEGLMPILVPLSVQEDSAHSVFKSSSAEIRREIQRGFEFSQHSKWEKLFEEKKKEHFVSDYPSFADVEISVPKRKHKLEWEGFVTSKLRRLCVHLEQIRAVNYVRIWPEAFTGDELKSSWRIGVNFTRNGGRNDSLTLNNVQRKVHAFQSSVLHEDNLNIGGKVQARFVVNESGDIQRNRKRTSDGGNNYHGSQKRRKFTNK